MKKIITISVYCTFPNIRSARSLSRKLLRDKKIACANIIESARSLYSWNGKMVDEREVIVFFKTQSKHYVALKSQILKNHPYDCPCIIRFNHSAGSKKYLEWIKRVTE